MQRDGEGHGRRRDQRERQQARRPGRLTEDEHRNRRTRRKGRVVRESQRERLLRAAIELFYRDGVAVCANALCRRAGISKKSMYELFDSKDALLEAALQRRIDDDAAFLLPPPGFSSSPRARLLHVFGQLEAFAKSPDYRGCAYLVTQLELKDPAHPASVAAAHLKKEHLESFFRAEAERGVATDPDFLTRQLAVLYDRGRQPRRCRRRRPARPGPRHRADPAGRGRRHGLTVVGGRSPQWTESARWLLLLRRGPVPVA
ncbi:TetR/AcrR family transcriptional regulator [Amycolatopsis sp. NPDC051373]|uniref:TetR/AcrR family transcriptional regulator n=1 Tax=Amycolatopsis sp. NPDC051373 TaxID=3155801 RepID=UPI00344FC6A0